MMKEVVPIKQDKKLSSLLQLILESREQWPGLFLIVFIALLAGVFKSITAAAWGSAIDMGVANNTDKMFLFIFISLLFVFLDAARTAIHYKIIGATTEKMFLKFRMRAFHILTDADVSVLEKTMRSGDVAMRINSDTDQLCDLIADKFSLIARYFFQGIIAAVGCIILSWQMSIAFFFLLPVSLWIQKRIAAPIQKQKKTALNSNGQAMSIATDILSGLMTVKSFNIEKEMSRRFGEALEHSYDETLKTEKIGIRMTAIKYVSGVLQVMILFIMGFFLISRGIVTVGQMLSFVALSAYVSETYQETDYMIRVVTSGAALAQRLYEVYDIPLEKSGSDKNLLFDDAFIKMEDLSFTYSEDTKLLEHINLMLKQNQKIAFIGPSGCGKSTLVKLICKFYNPTGGNMTLFGKTTEAIDLKSLRKEIALVTQDAFLFDGSIYENVACGREGAWKSEVIQAIKDANLWDFVQGLPEGVHTQVGEFGARLSGGQKQRICIARAIVRNARLVLLDEATSALDTQTEFEIQKALDNLLVDKAAILVAHRLSTIQNVDYIYCMEEGKVVEGGTPVELLEQKGYYYRMCCQQGLIPERGEAV